MSPDPPREDSNRDEDSNLRRFDGEFIEGAMMMMDGDQEFFLVPDAPYELDMENESDYTDTDEEAEGAAGANQNGLTMATASSSSTGEGDGGATAEGSEGDVVVHAQGRGRYRLLIPFPDPITAESDDGTGSGAPDNQTVQVPGETAASEITNSNKVEDIASASSSVSAPHSSSSTPSNKTQQQQPDPKREIELTEDKVETIMKVMKNFSLPSSSIPKWAAELDEDVWKKKLNDSITTKSTNHNNHSNSNVPLFEANFEER